MLNLTALAVEDYNTELRLALQKMGSMLMAWIHWQPARGEYISPVDLINPVDARRSTTRGGAPTRTTATYSRRWAVPTDIEIYQVYDRRDVARMFNQPEEQHKRNGALAVGREMDEIISEGYFATAVTGKKHETTEAFTGRDVAVGFGGTGNLGLNPAKVKEAKRKALAAHVQVAVDPLICPIGSQQWSDMLDHPEVTSSDFSATKALETGAIGDYLGVKFPLCEALPASAAVGAAGNRYVPFYAKSAMVGVNWSEVETHVDPLPEVEGRPIQISHMKTMGVTRTELNKMQRILCYEAALA